MSSVRQLHDRAMDFVDRGLRERARGNTERAIGQFRQALENEMAAIDNLSTQSGLGWSILVRSAATMALDCEDFRMAEKLASKGLAGDPHPEIVNELRDVWERANFHRHLELSGIKLNGTEVQLSLVGAEAAGGMTPLPELVTRVDSFQKLVYRIAQRILRKEYRSRIPNDVRNGYRAFAAAPTNGSFAIAIKLAHTAEQTSFPGMLGTEEVIGEFLDLLELANDSRLDEIEARIPDPNYRQNFVGLGKKLAPDGKRIRQVGFTLVNGTKTRSLSVTTPASQFLPARVEPKETGGRIVEASGILKFADASGRKANRIRLDGKTGSRHEVLVSPGLMDDIVRPMWNSHVTVRGSLRRRQRVIRLYEIWESDPESGKQGSRLATISDTSSGLQQPLHLQHITASLVDNTRC